MSLQGLVALAPGAAWALVVALLAATVLAIVVLVRAGRRAKTLGEGALPAGAAVLLALLGALGAALLATSPREAEFPTAVEILGAPSIVGAEDVDVIPGAGGAGPLLLVSATDRGHAAAKTNGALFLIDPANRHAEPQAVAADGRDSCSFHPHGIDVLETAGGVLVFVINHHRATDRDSRSGCNPTGTLRQPFDGIEIYRFDAATRKLVFEERLTDPRLQKINDLVAVDRHHLFVSRPAFGLGEFFVALGIGTDRAGQRRAECVGEVLEWNHGVWSTAADRLCYPNGVEVEPSGDQVALWVTTSLDGSLHRRPLRSSLTAIDIPGAGAPDNLTWAPTDPPTLLVPIHAAPARFFSAALSATLDGPRTAAGGCVARVSTTAGVGTKLTCPALTEHESADVPYRGDGGQLTAVSSAVCVGDDLYLGQVFERGVGRVAGGCVVRPAPGPVRSAGSPS
jgi:hypothetical protein